MIKDVPCFTGRDAELQRLLSLGGVGSRVTVLTVDGMAGVGKTSLVVHAAHLLADQFPDGQLFRCLQAHDLDRDPVRPEDALGDLLACTGVGPKDMPPTLDSRADLWRGRLAGRRVLLILDDAASCEQVEPLLPGSRGCLVLVTSRRRLIGLDAAVPPLSLDVLPVDQAVDLFVSIAHRDPTGLESTCVVDIVQRCGLLPLAIALLAGRLSYRPSWTLAWLADQFRTTLDRLGELSAGNRSVCAAFYLSYRDLDPSLQCFFRHLGLHPGTDIDAHAAAALAGITVLQAQRGLDELYTNHLIEEPAPHRYQFHDLLHEYIRTLLSGCDSEEDHSRAVERLLDYFQFTAETASRHVIPHAHRMKSPAVLLVSVAPSLPTRVLALDWMRAELPNLLACLDSAIERRQHARVVCLVAAMASFLRLEGPWTQAAALHAKAAAAAKILGNCGEEANALIDLARITYLGGGCSEAADLLRQALLKYRGAGDRLGEAIALNELGAVNMAKADFSAAGELLEEALAAYRAAGDCLLQARALTDLAHVRYMADNYAEAIDLLESARSFCRARDPVLEARALSELGHVYEVMGDYQAAVDQQESALAIYGERRCAGRASALIDLGRLRFRTGDYGGAVDLQDLAVAMYRELGSRAGEACALRDLGRVKEVTGDYQAAAGLQRRAEALYRECEDRLGVANALEELGRVHCLLGEYRAAEGKFTEALDGYRSIGELFGQASALNGLGSVSRLTGDHGKAARLMEQALAMCRNVGHRSGEIETLINLGVLLTESDGPREALPRYQQALQLARQLRVPLQEARALEGVARCTARAGTWNAALTDLRKAVAIYRNLGVVETNAAAAYLAELESEAIADG
ncbi:tetratricopeptide repeat protein [Streptomyces sp. UNOC14_S4]|uniref:tetratricopeptide repeat protein n=1 Tax=Streptomyces sp. UNOC14_S4 TaxID=2872340 RepID=UPI001E595724|nr:tetratricopeptide repeat protein [Streptomyces sp. UNOC14_S4]MCC3769331.1 tetratricopeptide repeat protein [Streptomyces sp. UNOC14_S4]